MMIATAIIAVAMMVDPPPRPLVIPRATNWIVTTPLLRFFQISGKSGLW